MAEIKPDVETFARIKVVGVGGSGSNAITRMIECKLTGVDFVAINTDAQDLHHCKASEKIHIGKNLTKGLGAGMNPELGRQAAEENRDEIQESLKSCDMVFIVYGAGGGTGSGAGPIVAEAAKEAGALTVGVVTRPFSFEGRQRGIVAEESLENLKDRVDTMISIQNDKLLQVIDRNTSLVNAFEIVDDVLRQGVQGISDLITKPGIVNVDFADVRSVMQDSGSALMGIGVASGESRASHAAKQAINSPLLDISIDGAKGVLFNITGGDDLTMLEVNEAANIITENVDPNARIIFGASSEETVKKGDVKITVVATGFEEGAFQSGGATFDRTKTRSVGVSVGDSNGAGEEGLNREVISEFNNKREIATEVLDESPSMIIEEKISDKKNTKRLDEEDDNSLGKNDEDDDDLDIPAFIRKKMGK
jgi:cell division protein FtsZ